MELIRNYFRNWVERRGKPLRLRFNRYVARYSKISNEDVLNPTDFAWTQVLEDNWETIRDEALALLDRRSSIPPLGEISPDHQRLDGRRSWRAFFLWGYGYRIKHNAPHAPKTVAIVSKIPGLITAMFSLHEPGTHLPYHCGVTKGFITCHLGLKVPADRDKCKIEVQRKPYHWEEGQLFIFDDTYHHEVWNMSDEDRVILLLHVKRPLAFPGNIFQSLVFTFIKRLPFIQDARRNLAKWKV